jgi:hypothetical protein
MSGANTSSQNNIADPFNGNIKGIRIVDDPANDIFYGAIFHKQTGIDNGGECTFPIINTKGDSECQAVDLPASAADIFIFDKNSIDSGDGVSFYSEPYGWNTGAKAGSLKVEDANINPTYIENADSMNFDYTNVDRPASYKFKCQNNNDSNQCSENACETFQDCPGSIKIWGSYLVGLYSEFDNNSSNPYCETFTQDVANLNVTSYLNNNYTNLGSVYIIPIT